MRLNHAEATLYREVADRFKLAKKCDVIEVGEAVRWALEGGELSLSQSAIIAIHVERMSESLRTHVTKDALGRKVRLRHCAETTAPGKDGKPVQKFLWAHVDEAPKAHLQLSLTQRKGKIGQDIESLRADLDYVNARLKRQGKRPIQLSLDFNGSGASEAAS